MTEFADRVAAFFDEYFAREPTDATAALSASIPTCEPSAWTMNLLATMTPN